MTTVIQRSFAGGELAPALYTRVDQVKYQYGLRTCRNYFIMRHSGATRRPGTSFVGEVNDSTKTVRLIKFRFNDSQTYVLEFGNLYFRVIKNGAYITEAPVSITLISQSNPAVLNIPAHGLSTGDEIFISGIVGMTQLNGRNFKVVVVDANNINIKTFDGNFVNSTGFSAYVSGGTAARIYTVTTTYVTADLPLLKYVQSGDVITIANQNYPQREVTRTADASWSIADITFAPSIGAPTITSSGSFSQYQVTSVAVETFEESLPTAPFSAGSADATPTAPISFTIHPATGAATYNVYKNYNGNGIYGFVTSSNSGTFKDIGITPDTTDTPPNSRNPFGNPLFPPPFPQPVTNYPAVVAYNQQRLMFGNTPKFPETVYGSRISHFKNFTTSIPIKDDDAISFALAGQEVNTIKNMINLSTLIIMTETGHWAIQGDANGVITPTQINARQQGYNGSNDLRPLIIENTALYVQSRGNLVRDLEYQFQFNSYRGNDLTIFSSHLFDGHEIVDWDFQKIPHSIVWAVREDGVLLSLTYIRDQQMIAWTRHDCTNGFVENVICIPDGAQDAVYFVVRRVINGRTVRYIEKMNSLYVDNLTNIVDSIYMDCALTYDGRNTNQSLTMTLSGGTNWTYGETLTLTASASYFDSSFVGRQINLTDSDGEVIRFTIIGFTSATVVTGHPNRTVPSEFRNSAMTTWTLCAKTLTNLWQLEGQEVSVFADGFVVSSPLNASVVTLTVTNGSITLDQPYGVIHVGLPIIADIETLDIDTANGETILDKRKLITRVSVFVQDTRGIFAGGSPPTGIDPLENLMEMKARDNEGYDQPVALKTDSDYIDIPNTWNNNGRVFLRQVDPVPSTILAIAPAGFIPFGGR